MKMKVVFEFGVAIPRKVLLHILTTKRDDDDDDVAKLCKHCKEAPVSSQFLRKTILVTASVIAAVFLAFMLFMICKRYSYYYYNNNNNNNRSRRHNHNHNDSSTEAETELVMAEEQGPLDHPIWYIHTVGLPQSLIDSITAFRYSKDLIDASECSVCLCEFQDADTLRLLPKCTHAFHVNCIDTWLRSHRNCPLCRAPVAGADNTISELNLSDDHQPAGTDSVGGVLETTNEGEGSATSTSTSTCRSSSSLERQEEDDETKQRTITMTRSVSMDHGDGGTSNFNVSMKTRMKMRMKMKRSFSISISNSNSSLVTSKHSRTQSAILPS